MTSPSVTEALEEALVRRSGGGGFGLRLLAASGMSGASTSVPPWRVRGLLPGREDAASRNGEAGGVSGWFADTRLGSSRR